MCEDELSKELINQLSNIIDGNHVNKDDLKPLNSEIYDVEALLLISWTFSSDYQESRIAGGSIIGEACSSIYELERVTDKLDDIAKFDRELRSEFIDVLKECGREGILKSNQQYLIKDFGHFSVEETCSSCNGNGKIRCTSCGGNGRQRCNYCSGSGRISQSRYNTNTRMYENYSTYCSSCGGSGNKRCSSCSGSGKVRCNSCHGHGYFVLTRHIQANTKPVFLVRTYTSIVNEELQEYLNNQTLSFIYNSIYFELSRLDSNARDNEIFIYKGDTIVLKQSFSIKSIEYICYALSNPPHPFIKPYIFDDLFFEELEYLDSKKGKNKYISKKRALAFFNDYSKLSVLDNAIKKISEVRKNSNENTSELVNDACQGYISEEAALKLSNHINKFMDKVSPAYSPFIWTFAVLVLSVIGFVFFEYHFEQNGTKNILEPLIFFTLITIILAIISYPLSLIITLFKRRHIPIEYRQKLRHKEIFKLYSKLAFGIFLLSLGYGILSNQKYLPKTNGIHQEFVIENVKISYKFLEEKGKELYYKFGIDNLLFKI